MYGMDSPLVSSPADAQAIVAADSTDHLRRPAAVFGVAEAERMGELVDQRAHARVRWLVR